MKKIRILIVDDHEFIRQGLRAVIEKQPGWEVSPRRAPAGTQSHLPKLTSPTWS